jgi:hypothetical protein
MRRPANCSELQHDPRGVGGRLGDKDATGRDAPTSSRKDQLASDPYQKLGGGVWQNPAVDLATNRITFAQSAIRLPISTFTSPRRQSLHQLAGVLIGYRQIHCHSGTSPGVWDLDAVSPPVLLNVKDGTARLSPAHPCARPVIYVHDRKDWPDPVLRPWCRRRTCAPPTKEGMFRGE